MKTSKHLGYKDQVKLIDAENPEYLDERDISEILESEEKLEIKISEPGVQCAMCDSSHVRKRMIDIPVMDGVAVFKRARVLYCAECGNTTLEKSYLEELLEKLKQNDIRVKHDTLLKIVMEGLAAFENNWSKLAKERKVISIYFPSKNKTPQKAQISMPVSDPLYSKLSRLTSEDVRNILGLHNYEDLRKEAELENRTLSQYLKFELAKKILMKASEANVKGLRTKMRASGVREQRATYKTAKKRSK